jgi:hypothetical protein
MVREQAIDIIRQRLRRRAQRLAQGEADLETSTTTYARLIRDQTARDRAQQRESEAFSRISGLYEPQVSRAVQHERLVEEFHTMLGFRSENAVVLNVTIPAGFVYHQDPQREAAAGRDEERWTARRNLQRSHDQLLQNIQHLRLQLDNRPREQAVALLGRPVQEPQGGHLAIEEEQLETESEQSGPEGEQLESEEEQLEQQTAITPPDSPRQSRRARELLKKSMAAVKSTTQKLLRRQSREI